MDACSALKTNFTELSYLTDIKKRWKPSINSYFTINNYKKAYTNATIPVASSSNSSKPTINELLTRWQQFYLNCNL